MTFSVCGSSFPLPSSFLVAQIYPKIAVPIVSKIKREFPASTASLASSMLFAAENPLFTTMSSIGFSAPPRRYASDIGVMTNLFIISLEL